MGGLSKKAHQQENIAKTKNLPVIKADAGALFFKLEQLPPSPAADQDKATAEGIAEGYAIMKYDAIGMGKEDFAAGLGFLQSLQKRFSLPLVSANLVKKSTKKPMFKPFVITKTAGVRIGITALTDPVALSRLTKDDDTAILGWRDVLPGVIKELQSKTDMIIVMSTLPASENTLIANENDTIHILLQGGYAPANLGPSLLNNTLVCQIIGQGKFCGSLDITWSASKRWKTGQETEETIQANQRELDRLTWQITRMEKDGAPAATTGAEPALVESYQRLKTRQIELETNLKELQKKKQSQPNASPCIYENTFIAMETSLPDDPAVQKIVEKAKGKISAIGMAAAKPLPPRTMETVTAPRQMAASDSKANTAIGQIAPPGGTAGANTSLLYLGWKRCASCHAKESEKWQTSRHAGAFQTLVAKNQQYNLGCVSCHVTGAFSDKPLYSPSALPEDMLAVGCEVCHGAGEAHAANPGSRRLTKKPPADTCLRCHTSEHDDAFDYDRKIKILAETGH